MKPLSIKNIKQTGLYTFDIEWNNGTFKEYRLSAVQRVCPCAGCQGNGIADEDVIATKIENVGRYALRIHFSSGCSQGIYSFDLLNQLGMGG